MRADVDSVLHQNSLLPHPVAAVHTATNHCVVRMIQRNAFAIGLALDIVFRQIAIGVANVGFSFILVPLIDDSGRSGRFHCAFVNIVDDFDFAN